MVNKYKNRVSFLDGYRFDSGLERAVYLAHKAMEQAGELIIEACQDTVHLVAGIKYRTDFRMRSLPSQEVYWVEAKGFPTDVWMLKKKLWAHGFGPGKLEIWKGSAARPFLAETVFPKELK